MPACDYTYDPLYRLIEANGPRAYRPIGASILPPDGNDRDYPFDGAAQLNDLQALQHYTERYAYDPVGNFLSMSHRAGRTGNWTRTYAYCEASLLEPRQDKQSAERDGAADASRALPSSDIATTRTAT